MAAERSPDGTDDPARDEASHAASFDELDDGCGCAEIREFLSERRRRE